MSAGAGGAGGSGGLPPAAAARLVSALGPEHPARNGWVTGRVTEAHADGTIRLATAGGSLLLRIPGASAEVGAMLRVRVDGADAAALRAEPPRPASLLPPGAQAGAAQPQAPTAVPSGPAPALPPLLPLTLAEMAPVAPGLAPLPAAEAQATQALAAAFPSVGSPAFAPIAALFPLVLRDGTLRGLAERRRPGASPGPAGRLAEAARTALDTGTARTAEDPANLRWVMPFFTGGRLSQSHWGQSGDPEMPLHVFVEASFPTCGRVRLNAIAGGRTVALHMHSEFPLPEPVLAELREAAEALGARLGFRVEMAQVAGGFPEGPVAL